MTDDIKTHAKKLLKPYVRKPEAFAIIESARILARLALESEDMYLSHRRKMLNNAVWFCTEADGKWMTRFKSKNVMELAKNEPGSLVRINHEHVFTRKSLVDEMLANREILLMNLQKLHLLLGTAVGCVVTSSEHAELTDGSGWQRYAGKVEVYDTAEIPLRIVQLHVAEVLSGIDK